MVLITLLFFCCAVFSNVFLPKRITLGSFWTTFRKRFWLVDVGIVGACSGATGLRLRHEQIQRGIWKPTLYFDHSLVQPTGDRFLSNSTYTWFKVLSHYCISLVAICDLFHGLFCLVECEVVRSSTLRGDMWTGRCSRVWWRHNKIPTVHVPRWWQKSWLNVIQKVSNKPCSHYVA